MTNNAETAADPVAVWTGRLVIFGAEAVYLGLCVYLVAVTSDATHGKAPDISGVVQGIVAALAPLLGVLFAVALGTPPATDRLHVTRRRLKTIRNWLDAHMSLPALYGLGVVTYGLSGLMLGGVYLFRQDESPSIVKTVAIAFGGYVVSYLGVIFKQYKPAG